jgi:hypothetical protein
MQSKKELKTIAKSVASADWATRPCQHGSTIRRLGHTAK